MIGDENQIGDCPAMRQLVETFLDCGLCAEDVFLNCSILKNVVVEKLFENRIDKLKIREITNILDKNLYRIIGIYTKKRLSQEQESLFHAKLVEEHVALSITDANGIIVYVTDAFVKLSGYEASELIGQTHSIIRHPEVSDNFFKALWGSLRKKHSWKGKIKNAKKDGGEFIAKTEIIPFKSNENGDVIEYISIRHDITDRELSNIDQLTGLYNRRYYVSHISKLLEESEYLSLMIIDIDHFKNINDLYGHDFGDLVLKKFSKCLAKNLKSKDICVRWGGEEFVILLPNIRNQKAIEIANRIREDVQKLVIQNASSAKDITITCSIGVSEHNDKDSVNDFFKRADTNLYKAKNGGRNRVV